MVQDLKPRTPSEVAALAGAQIFEPVDQATTDAFVAVAGASMNLTFHRMLALTIRNVHASNSIDWRLMGANESDFSDAVEVVTPTAIAALAQAQYVSTAAAYRFYRPEVKNTVAATPGTARVRAVAK